MLSLDWLLADEVDVSWKFIPGYREQYFCKCEWDHIPYWCLRGWNKRGILVASMLELFRSVVLLLSISGIDKGADDMTQSDLWLYILNAGGKGRYNFVEKDEGF